MNDNFVLLVEVVVDTVSSTVLPVTGRCLALSHREGAISSCEDSDEPQSPKTRCFENSGSG